MYIHPPNSSKWDIKPPLFQRNMDSRPISLFRTLDSREARTLGLATASHKRHLGAGNADLQALEIAESLRAGPQKNIRPCAMLRLGTNRFSLLGSCWEVAIHCLQLRHTRSTPRNTFPSLPRKHSCHSLQGLELLVTELLEILRAHPEISAKETHILT